MTEFRPIRQERVEVQDGLGLLEVCGTTLYETCLMFRGRPIILEWDDYEGSVAQYLVQVNDPVFQDAIHAFTTVSRDIDLHQTLATQIEPILRLFFNGAYKLTVSQLVKDDFTVIDLNISKHLNYTQYYPFGDCLICTFPKSRLDLLRVADWIAQIESGNRPPVVVASHPEGWGDFVIDGHHRLEAYEQLSIPPFIISITPDSPRPFELALVDAMLRDKPKLFEQFHKNRPKSLDDLRALPSDVRAELIGDELKIFPPRGDMPASASGAILASLYEHSRFVYGRAYSSTVAYVIENQHRKFPIAEKYVPYARYNSFSPDVSFHVGARTGMGFLEGAPVFAVEIRGEDDYHPYADLHREIKRADYFACGTLVVWDVDLLGDDVVRSYRADQPYTPTVFRRGDTASAEPAVPGWMLPVNTLFE